MHFFCYFDGSLLVNFKLENVCVDAYGIHRKSDMHVADITLFVNLKRYFIIKQNVSNF